MFQAALGMWTVTLLLKPVIVTLHLLGGMTILGMLTWLAVGQFSVGTSCGLEKLRRFRSWATISHCANLNEVPPVDFRHGFHFIRELGVTASGTPLSGEALNAIQWTHRVGALITFACLLLLGVGACSTHGLRFYGGADVGVSWGYKSVLELPIL